MKIVVTGGAGFIGGHLVDRLVTDGHEVTVFDDLTSGSLDNVHPDAKFVNRNVVNKGWLDDIDHTDRVYHLASPASPMDYLDRPLHTLLTGSTGTLHALYAAQDSGAPLLFTSTSEVYGDPEVHPQPETYWGNVHTTGPRACYDESKRYAEALISVFERRNPGTTRIVRLFNTYGPRMRPSDGRVISTFVRQGLAGEPLTVFGDGSQTRSISFVDDTVEGVIRAMEIGHPGPLNLGSRFELSVLDIAFLVCDALNIEPDIVFRPLPEDDPRQRRADASLAKSVLDWEPTTTPREGVARTVEWMASELTARTGR